MDEMIDLDREIWKLIPDMLDNYKISNYARIYSINKKKFLKTTRDCASLYLNSKRIDIPVLKLMRDLFTTEEDLSKFKKVIDLPNEVWKPVKGFEKYYHISTAGRLKILDRICWKSVVEKTATKFKHERISASCHNTDWYPSHILYGDDKKKSVNIHKLVAEHFIPNPNNLPQINHKNGLKNDNRVENLEWCTAKHNTIHAYTTGLAKAKSIISDEIALNIKKEIKRRRENNIKLDLKEIAKNLNISVLIVKDISRNKTWKHIKL